MKLLTYYKKNGYGLGALVDNYILDLWEATGASCMISLLNMGEKGMKKAQEAVEKAGKRLNFGDKNGMLVLDKTRLAAPIPRTRKNIVCLGLNYAEHVREGLTGREPPKYPVFFTKPPTSITGPYDDIIYNKAVQKLDYEVELAFVIGKKGKYIAKENAFKHVAGYMVFQDISARNLQNQHLQWYRGKSQDTFAPMGPYLVTKDQVTYPENLNIWCKVNGEIRQNANTSDLIFDIPTIINTISDGITLEVGDVFATGTPSGVGAAHKSGLLKVGDYIESGIEGLGIMKNKVIAEK